MFNVALLCVDASPLLRPAMSTVVSILEGQTTIPPTASLSTMERLRWTSAISTSPMSTVVNMPEGQTSVPSTAPSSITQSLQWTSSISSSQMSTTASRLEDQRAVPSAASSIATDELQLTSSFSTAPPPKGEDGSHLPAGASTEIRPEDDGRPLLQNHSIEERSL